MIETILMSLEQIGFGVVLFCVAYVANMGLGAWRSVKLDGVAFDWRLILQSIVKFIVLGLSLALLCVAIAVIPVYASYIGIVIEAETLATIDGLVITGGFLTATIRYAVDAISKVKAILE